MCQKWLFEPCQVSLGVILAAAETIWLAVFIYLSYLSLGLKKKKYQAFLPLNTCQMGKEWWNNEKIDGVYGVKKHQY